MVLKYLGCDKKYFRYELYDGDRMELYVETKLSARATAKLLFSKQLPPLLWPFRLLSILSGKLHYWKNGTTIY